MNNTTENNSNNIINLDLSDRLKEKNIVNKFYYHIPTQHLKISLNHKYPPINAIFKIDIDDWSKNSEKIIKILKPKGVDKEDIQLLCVTLDNHWKKIFDLIHNNNNPAAIVVSDLSDLSDQINNNTNSDNFKNQLSQVSSQMSLHHLTNLLSRYSDIASFCSSIVV